MSAASDGKSGGMTAISELPKDELVRYGRSLGLNFHGKMGQGEMLRRIRERQELLIELDRQTLLDIVVWARHPVRQSSSKEELAGHIAIIRKMDFHGLSDRGVVALARLRGVTARDGESRALIEARLRDAEPYWDRIRRHRRQVVGKVLNKMVGGALGGENEAYRFLPEESSSPTLEEHIEDEGIVGGIARKLRGVADDYVREKLDEIEIRIDRKLDEIDRRLAEWRDQEIANRLRIIKITLVASVIVALLSLGYTYIKSRSAGSVPVVPEKPAHAGLDIPCEIPRIWI